MASKPPWNKSPGQSGSLQRVGSESRSRIGSGALPTQRASSTASKENIHPGTAIASSPCRRVINIEIDAPPLQPLDNRDFDLLERNDSKLQVPPKRSSSQSLKTTSFLKADASDQTQAQMDWDWIKKSLAERTITLDRERGAIQTQGQGADLQRNLFHSATNSATSAEQLCDTERDLLHRVSPGPYKREEQLELDMEALKARIRCLEQEAGLGSCSGSSIARQSTEIANLALELTVAKERTLQDTVTMQQMSVDLVQLQAEIATKTDALRFAEEQTQELQKTFCDFESQLSAKDAEIASLKVRLQEESQRVEYSSLELLDFREALAEMEDRCNQKDNELAQEKHALEEERQKAREEQRRLQQQLQALQVQNVEAQSQLLLLQAQNHQQEDQREAEEMRELRRTLLDIERQALHKDAEIMKLKSLLQDERSRAAEAERQQQAVRQLESKLLQREAAVLKLEAEQQDAKQQDTSELQRLQQMLHVLERQVLEKNIEIARLRSMAEQSPEERTMLRLPRETFSEMERQASVKETEITKLRDMLEEERLQALRDLQQMQESLQQAERKLADREEELANIRREAGTQPGKSKLVQSSAATDLMDLCHADPAVGHVIASMEAMIHQKDSEIEGLHRDMEELAQEFLNLERKIRGMEATLLDKEEELEQLRSTAQERQAVMPSCDVEKLSQLEGQLSQRDSTIAQLQQQLKHTAAPQESLQFYRELDERQREEIRWQREELGRCREEVARVRTERERQFQEVHRQAKELEQQRDRTTQLTQALSHKDAEFHASQTRLEEELASALREVGRLTEALAHAAAAAAEQLEEKEAELRRQATAMAALEASVAKLTAVAEEREVAMERHAEELQRLQSALETETDWRLALEVQHQDLRRVTNQFSEEATQVFKDHELDPEPDCALLLSQSEQQDRRSLGDKEALQWRDIRSYEDECWNDLVSQQRMQWAEEEEAMQNRLQYLEDMLVSREAEVEAATEIASTLHRRSSVPAFDDLPDPFSYPVVSDTQCTQSDTASTTAWLASSSNLTAFQGSTRSRQSSSLAHGGASVEKVRADLLPQFNQQSSSKAPPRPAHQQAMPHDPSGRCPNRAVPANFIPKDYVLPLDFPHPSSSPLPVQPQPQAAPPSPHCRAVEQAMPLPPAIFLSQATAQATPASSSSTTTTSSSESGHPTPLYDERYLHGTHRSARSTATSSSGTRASSVNPSSRGLTEELPSRHRSQSAARDHATGDVGPRAGLFESLSGLKMRTHDSSLRRMVDKERERLEKIAEKQRKEELHAEKERERQERKEREKAARKKEGKRKLLLGLWS